MIPVAILLDFELRHPSMSQAKYQAIRAEIHVSPVRYYQQLTQVLTDEALLAEALQHDPTTTHRLLRQRDARAAARKARTRS